MTETASSRKKPDPPPEPPREFQSTQLFGQARMIVIHHQGQPYRLLITRNDRLILQK